MSSEAILVAACAVGVIGIIAVVVFGLKRSWLTGTLCALALPVPLFGVAESAAPHFGITMGSPTVMTYTLPVLGLYAASVLRRSSWRLHAFAGVSLLWLMALAISVWGIDDLVVSGIGHLMTALLAFVSAAVLASERARGEGLLAWMALSATLVLLVETFSVVVQRAGIALSLQPEITYYLNEGRALGTFDHPTTLGKFGLLLLVLLLPATTSADQLVRRTSWTGVALAVLSTGLTLSRANTVAIVGTVLVWILIQRRDAMTKRTRMIAVGVVVAVSAPALILALARFRIDSGGDRGHFWEVGLPYVRDHFFQGLGTNSYVEVVGATDWLTSQGYPVHNAFVLMLAEIGIVGASLMFVPVVGVVVLALTRVRSPGVSSLYARAVLAVLPGLLVVTCTGWGMIASSTFVLWYLVTGFAWGVLAGPADTPLIDDRKQLTFGTVPFGRGLSFKESHRGGAGGRSGDAEASSAPEPDRAGSEL